MGTKSSASLIVWAIFGLLLLAQATSSAVGESANSITFAVSSSADAPDVNPGDGACLSAAQECTLRAAFDEANAAAGDYVIVLPAGTYLLTAGRLYIRGPDVDFGWSFELRGEGADRTEIRGSGDDRVLTNSTVAKISGITISGGVAERDGGGIYNSGTLTLLDSSVQGNTATFGGGIYNRGPLTLINTTISGNRASSTGGGLNTECTGNVEITNVTISGNDAFLGGGISCYGKGPGPVRLTNVTVTRNSDLGLFGHGSIVMTGSIIADNSSVGSTRNCGGTQTIESGGGNLDDDGTCQLTAASDQSNVDPLLGPLQINGGTTPTHALFSGSPAIDSLAVSSCPDADQRGISRPQGAACDIGAYELSAEDLPFGKPVVGGVNLVAYRGGSVSQLEWEAASEGASAVAVTVSGKFLVLVVGAPGFVNQGFASHFADGLSDGQVLALVVPASPTVGAGCVPSLISPVAGATLDNGRTDQTELKTWTFRWGECPGADEYQLIVQRIGSTIPVADEILSTREFVHSGLGYIATKNLSGWTWQVRARVGGQWDEWSVARSFEVEPPDTD